MSVAGIYVNIVLFFRVKIKFDFLLSSMMR